MDKLTLPKIKPDSTYQHIFLCNSARCIHCENKECLYICPSKVFQWDYAPGTPIKLTYTRCIECGACRLICENILFSYPIQGFGVQYLDG